MRTFLILLSLFVFGAAVAQRDTIVESLLRDVPGWMAENHVPCTGIGLIQNGRIKWLKVFGELSQGHPAPPNTLFNIASQTKPVTAMLTLKLVQAGLWDLDEPLSHYWIDPDIAGSPYLDKLTTRMVLSHQTGFPNWRSGKLAFNFEPGTRFGYSGEGFEYLRRALESKFDQGLDVLMRTYLWAPLGMGDTEYWSEGVGDRFAVWHDGVGRPYAVSMRTPVNAADDLITTVEDYCKFGISVMNGLGLSDTLVADLSRPQVLVKANYYRALGWGLVDGLAGGEYALEHGGSDIGVRTMALFLPESKSGIVVMTNADNGLFVIDQVIRRALPAGAQIQAIMNKGTAAHVRITIADSLIRGYAGDYVQENGKALKIEQDGNAIKVSGDGAPTATLYPEAPNKFFLEGYDVQMEFPDLQTLVVYEGGKKVVVAKRKGHA